MPDTQWGPHKWWWLSVTTIPRKPRARRNLSHRLTPCRWSSGDPRSGRWRGTRPFSLLPSSGSSLHHRSPRSRDEARWSWSSCCSLPCSDCCTARWGPFGQISSRGGGFPPEGQGGEQSRSYYSAPGAARRSARSAQSCPVSRWDWQSPCEGQHSWRGAAQDTRKSSTRFSQYITIEMPSLCT